MTKITYNVSGYDKIWQFPKYNDSEKVPCIRKQAGNQINRLLKKAKNQEKVILSVAKHLAFPILEILHFVQDDRLH